MSCSCSLFHLRFHIAFITVHLPPYLVDRGLDVSWGGWVLAFIGLFNILARLLPACSPPFSQALSAFDHLLRCARRDRRFVLAPMSPASR